MKKQMLRKEAMPAGRAAAMASTEYLARNTRSVKWITEVLPKLTTRGRPMAST